MKMKNVDDPNKKEEKPQQDQAAENTGLDEGVYIYHADGTPMDTSDRTYISVDLPEEEDDQKAKDE